MQKNTRISQHVHVKIVIRPIMEESTRPPPLATDIHMDDAFIFDNLTRYARRPGVDNPSDLLITSFCTKRPSGGGQHQIYACGTKIYDGIPVLKHDVMVRLASATLPDAMLTPLQSEEIYTRIFTAKTTDALDGMTNQDFKQAGITINDAPNLTWTNANALTFHRSPTTDQSIDSSSKGEFAALRPFHVRQSGDRRRCLLEIFRRTEVGVDCIASGRDQRHEKRVPIDHQNVSPHRSVKRCSTPPALAPAAPRKRASPPSAAQASNDDGFGTVTVTTEGDVCSREGRRVTADPAPEDP